MSSFKMFDQQKVKELSKLISTIPLSEWKKRTDKSVDYMDRYYIIHNRKEIILRPRDGAWRPYLIIDGIKIHDKGEIGESDIDQLSDRVIQYYKKEEYPTDEWFDSLLLDLKK